VGHVAHIGRCEVHTKLWSENLKVCRWEDNIRMDLREIGWEGVDRISYGSVQGPVVTSCEHGNVHSGSMKGGEFRLSSSLLHGLSYVHPIASRILERIKYLYYNLCT
jgi:hypothetical protein